MEETNGPHDPRRHPSRPRTPPRQPQRHRASLRLGGNHRIPHVMLVHGFPETWWVFHKLIPLLSAHHRVFAPDLRGFGDSATATGEHDSATAARDLSELITLLDVGPVHLTGQDISGPTTFRVAATHPDLVRSYTGIETGLPGFGLEMLADVTRGGAWHIGVLAAPGIPEMLLAGRERAFLSEYALPTLSATPDAFTDQDIDELARSFTRPDAFKGAAGLYRSMLREGEEIRELAAGQLTMPVLAIGGGSGDFTPGDAAPSRQGREFRIARRHRPLRGDGSTRTARERPPRFLPEDRQPGVTPGPALEHGTARLQRRSVLHRARDRVGCGSSMIYVKEWTWAGPLVLRRWRRSCRRRTAWTSRSSGVNSKRSGDAVSRRLRRLHGDVRGG